MAGPFDNSFRPTPNFGQGAPGMDAQSPASFSPDLSGAPQPGNFMDDPQFQAAFQQVLDSNPQLADDIQKDPELQSHIMNVIAQGPGAMKGAGPNGIMPQGMDVGAVGGMPPGTQSPQAPPVPQQSQSFANLYGATPGPEKSGAGGFGQYVNSQAGRDDMMMGLIMQNMGRDPNKALEMAMQFKQGRDQRRYQAEQNDLQREATRENLKLKKEYDNQVKEDKQWQNDRTKGIASLRQAGVTEDELTAKYGVWDKDNNEEMTRGVTALVAEKKAKDTTEKKQQQDLKNRETIAGNVHQRGAIIGNKYINKTDKDGKPNPDYDPQFATELQGIADSTKARQDVMKKYDAARYDLIKIRTKMEGKAKTPEQKTRIKLKFTMLGDIQDKINEARKELDKYKPYSEGDNIYGQTYSYQVGQLNDALKEYSDLANEIEGIDMPELEAADPAAGTETAAPAPVAPPAPAQAGGTAADAAPVPEAIANYRDMMKKAATPEAKAEVSRLWKIYYAGFPEPTGE